MSEVWKWLTNTFETGDLIPALVVVSAVHYAVVLAGRDYWAVAIIIGALVDLGHYRWVRAAARYTGGKPKQLVTRWFFAALMTVISLAYHLRYYDGDLWFAVPMPILIASLAWLAEVDKKAKKKDDETGEPVKAQLPIETVEVKPLPTHEPAPVILSVKEQAQLAGVSERTMYRRIAAGNGNGHHKVEIGLPK